MQIGPQKLTSESNAATGVGEPSYIYRVPKYIESGERWHNQIIKLYFILSIIQLKQSFITFLGKHYNHSLLSGGNEAKNQYILKQENKNHCY